MHNRNSMNTKEVHVRQYFNLAYFVLEEKLFLHLFNSVETIFNDCNFSLLEPESGELFTKKPLFAEFLIRKCKKTEGLSPCNVFFFVFYNIINFGSLNCQSAPLIIK